MWRVEYDPGARVLTLLLSREVREAEMRDLARAHAQALEATGGQSFWVFVDLRGMRPLDDEAAAIFSDMKRVAAQLPGYRGRAVLVDGPTVAMQQRNATLADGGDPAELITIDAERARRFVRS